VIFPNCFMTFAWYGHLKYGHSWPLWKAILVSWAIALFEYCLAVPANRLGYGEFSGFQLKIIQEVVTLVVFMVFAITFLKENSRGIMSWRSRSSASPRSSPLPSRHPDRLFELTVTRVAVGMLAVHGPDLFRECTKDHLCNIQASLAACAARGLV
jgi:uncharacterized protein